LREIAAVDKTGEASWLWGQEDVAQNGLDRFEPDERALDVRSVYLGLYGNKLWWRTYVSAEAAPQNNLNVYLFVDADSSSSSGRSAAATEIEPAFTADPSLGGYEYVVSVRGDGAQARLWAFDPIQVRFVESTTTGNQIATEAGVFLDPLRILARDHGYVQATIPENLVGISGQCQARFYVRATSQTQNLGPGDLDIGDAIACTPADVDLDRVPDLVEPVQYGCVRDDQCPADGVCWQGHCWLAPACNDDADCGTNQTCVDGTCAVVTAQNCRNGTECASGVCENGLCVACTSDADCGSEQVCAPEGRCVARSTAGTGVGGTGATGTGATGTGATGTGATGTGATRTGATGTGATANSHSTTSSQIELDDGERVQGGACACRTAPNNRNGQFAWLGLLGIARFGRRRRRSEGPKRRASDAFERRSSR
jgi:MYXO-CTERM domain-containing protein